MNSLRQQQTLGAAAAVNGFGFWSGRDVRVEFHPAPVDSGVVFLREDLPGCPRIPATVDRRIEMPRRTTLAEGSARVEMVEHILAALAGLQIDNCEVRVNAAEMPGCDGSSLPFVTALQAAGTVPQDALRPQLMVTEPARVGDEQCWVEAHPEDRLMLKYRLDYGPGPIPRQCFELAFSREAFLRELAPARTFLLEQEAAWLRQRGLGQRVSGREVLVFGADGPIDNALRFADECARHKTLDMLGDLALCGLDVVGRVTAFRSGHRQNADLVRALLAEGRVIEPRRKSA